MNTGHPLYSMISDMEADVCDVERWGQLLSTLSSCGHTLQPELLHLLGDPLRELGVRLEAQWKAALEASKVLS